MKYQPRPHQKIADEFIQKHDRSVLVLDMGLGKTIITLNHINRLINEEFAVSKVLVICPKLVCHTWSDEIRKWELPLTYSIVLGNPQQRRNALQTEADIYIINRENVVWLIEESGTPWDYDCVVIDELSSFKSSSSKRWRALRKVIFQSTYVYGLTGTPAGNGYLDLWPEIYLIDRGERLGRTFTAYKQDFFTPGAHKGYVVYEWKLKHGAQKTIDNLLGDICLSMSKEDWLNMPPITYNNIKVELTSKARKEYERFKADRILPVVSNAIAESMDDDYDSAIVAEMAAQVTSKLLQMANGNVYDDQRGVVHLHDCKIDALKELADTVAPTPLLVFYSFRHDLSALKEAFPKAEEMSEEVIEKWNSGDIPMLLAHPASAGYGLNLQQGSNMIVWYGLPWSLELYQQANARLYRLGQEKPVIIHHLITEDTVDERVVKALQQKDITQRELLDSLKHYIVSEVE